MNNEKCDVRTILFSKTNNDYQSLFNKFAEYSKNNIYITLGNYDAVTVYPTLEYDLSEQTGHTLFGGASVFSMLLEEKKALTKLYCTTGTQSRSSFHPIHVVKPCGDTVDGEKRVRDFWSSEMPNLAITFFYGLNELPISDLEKKLESLIKLDDNFDFQIYRSFNMSRLVIFWKGKRLDGILNAITSIKFSFSNIHMNTICGFSYCFDQKEIVVSDFPEEESLPMVKITGNIAHPQNNSTDFLKISNILNDKNILSETTSKEKSEQKKSQSCKDYLAYGNDDFNLLYYNIQTRCLVEFLNDRIKKGDNYSEFANLKTHVHTLCSCTGIGDEPFETTSIAENLLADLRKYMDCRCSENRCVIRKCDWVFPLTETIYLLKDMVNDPSLSQIIYFAYDSLTVLIKALGFVYEKCTKDEEFQGCMRENQKALNRYVKDLNILINQLTRLDSSLLRDPGNNPLLYDMIPTGLLAYYYSYIQFTIDTLNKASQPECDEGNKDFGEGEYSMLLFPTLARYIKIDRVLSCDPEDKKPIYPPFQSYLVEIPYEMLYRPKELLVAVMHEIMHFCGETIRCRRERYKCFIGFVAEAFVSDLNVNTIENKTYDIVYDLLEKKIPYARYGMYLEVLERHTRKIVDRLYQDPNLKNELHRCCINDGVTEAKNSYKLTKAINDAARKEYLLGEISDIAFLFRECYADLIVIKLLELDDEEYLQDIFQEVLTVPKDDLKEVRYAQFEQRIAAVLYSLGKNYDDVNITGCSDEMMLRKNIIKLMKAFKSAENQEEVDLGSNSEIYFWVRSMLALVEYLKECLRVLDNLMNKDTSLAKIKHYYEISYQQEKIFSDEYFDLIEKDRERIRKLMRG